MNEIDKIQDKINKLEDIGKECGCELHLPPLKTLKNSSNPFYVLKTTEASKSSKLVMVLSACGFGHKISFAGIKQIIEVTL
jgi:hypothetical protein